MLFNLGKTMRAKPVIVVTSKQVGLWLVVKRVLTTIIDVCLVWFFLWGEMTRSIYLFIFKGGAGD